MSTTTIVERAAVAKPGGRAERPVRRTSDRGPHFHPAELVRRARRHEAYLFAINDAVERVRLSFRAAHEHLAESGELGRLTSLEVLRQQIDLARPDLSDLAQLVNAFDGFDLGNGVAGFAHPTPMPPDPFAYQSPVGGPA